MKHPGVGSIAASSTSSLEDSLGVLPAFFIMIRVWFKKTRLFECSTAKMPSQMIVCNVIAARSGVRSSTAHLPLFQAPLLVRERDERLRSHLTFDEHWASVLLCHGFAGKKMHVGELYQCAIFTPYELHSPPSILLFRNHETSTKPGSHRLLRYMNVYALILILVPPFDASKLLLGGKRL